MVRRRSVLLGVVVLAILDIVIAATGHSEDRWLAPFGVFVVLVLPGYALSVALLPDLEGATRLLVTLGLSLVVAVLGGLVLNTTQWGLRPLPWALWSGSWALAGATAALVLGRDADRAPEFRWAGFSVGPGLGLALAALILTFSLSVVSLQAHADNPQFTQLWAVPLQSGQNDALEIGVKNQETAPMSYRVQVEDGGKQLVSWEIHDLKPGEQWTNRISVVVRPSTTRFLVQLFLSSSPGDVYRAVEISPATFGVPKQ